MSHVIDLLSETLSGSNATTLSQNLNLGEDQTKSALSAAIPLLMGALNKNTDAGGAEALSQALSNDHDGSILDDVQGYLQGGDSSGASILKHVLGGKTDGIASQLSQLSGLDSSKVTQLLIAIAPLVLGALGKKQKSDGLDASALSDLLTQEQNYAQEKSPEGMGYLGKLLDSDGDGNVSDDLTSIGTQLLSNFLR